jgi:hypothetical protein
MPDAEGIVATEAVNGAAAGEMLDGIEPGGSWTQQHEARGFCGAGLVRRDALQHPWAVEPCATVVDEWLPRPIHRQCACSAGNTTAIARATNTNAPRKRFITSPEYPLSRTA